MGSDDEILRDRLKIVFEGMMGAMYGGNGNQDGCNHSFAIKDWLKEEDIARMVKEVQEEMREEEDLLMRIMNEHEDKGKDG